MLRSLCATALLAVAVLPAPAAAQVSGDGPFTWTDLQEPVKAVELVFLGDGTLVTMSSKFWRLPPGGAWELVDVPSAVAGDAALPLGADTLIAGSVLSRSFDGGRTWDYPACAGPDGNDICPRRDVDQIGRAHV